MLMVYCNRFFLNKINEYLRFISLLFPVLIILYILFLFYWFFKKKYKFFFLFLIVFLIYIPNIILWINISNKKESVNQLKIISYNVFYGKKKGIHSIKKYIKNQNPDVVLLQEIWSRQWKKKDNLLLNFNNVVFPYVGISSKHPIINQKWINLYNTNGHACWADIAIQKDTIRFFSIYLEPIYLTKNLFQFSNKEEIHKNIKEIKKRMDMGFKVHRYQLQCIKHEIKKSPYPSIVGGDLNAVPNSYEYYQLSSFLEDGFKLKGNGLGTTFHEYFYPIKIDYIFFDSNFEILYSRVDQKIKLSDHFPIITLFKKNKFKFQY